ncbi:Ubiquitin-associated and SH3 domain-containing protein A [Manis javanica]|nr:Ubiquitin-associated and SH3 domain-containing protein A [Manis javanica]
MGPSSPQDHLGQQALRLPTFPIGKLGHTREQGHSARGPPRRRPTCRHLDLGLRASVNQKGFLPMNYTERNFAAQSVQHRVHKQNQTPNKKGEKSVEAT